MKRGGLKALVALTAILFSCQTTIVRANDNDRNDDSSSACRHLPSHNTLRMALAKAQAQQNGGFGLNM